MVCRDRSALYAEGIRQGAPQAVEAFLHDQRTALQAAAALTVQALTVGAGPVSTPRRYRGRHQCSQAWQQRQEAAQQQRHAAWVTSYEASHTRHAQGTPVTTMAPQRGITRPTVYAYLRRTRPPSPRSPQRSGQVLRPYMAYVSQRWREGCPDSMQLEAVPRDRRGCPRGPPRVQDPISMGHHVALVLKRLAIPGNTHPTTVGEK